MATATTNQGSDYERALARADASGVEILGTGRYKTGLPFYLVTSSTEPTHPHIVTVDGPNVICSCPSRRMCKHVAVVRRELARQASEIQSRIEQTRAAATAAQRDSAPLYRSNAPFSLFKTA